MDNTTNVAEDYVTCNATTERHFRHFLFYPKGRSIEGTVRVLLSADYLYPHKGAMKHDKVIDALIYASKYHPQYAVSLTLAKTRKRGGWPLKISFRLEQQRPTGSFEKQRGGHQVAPFSVYSAAIANAARFRHGTRRILTDTTRASGPTRASSWPIVGGWSKFTAHVAPVVRCEDAAATMTALFT